MSQFNVHQPEQNSKSALVEAFKESHALCVGLQKRIAHLENIVCVYQCADETGYVDGEGFVIGFDQLTADGEKVLAKRELEMKLEAVNYIISHESCKCVKNKSADCNAVHLADLHNYAFYLEEQLRNKDRGVSDL